MNIAKLEIMINEEIRDKEIRLIGPDGAQLGVVSAAEALAIADEHNLDFFHLYPTLVYFLSFNINLMLLL